MRVLLTGASGFLGANCLRYLLDETDWDIVCPASFSHRGVPERITMTVRTACPVDEWQRVTVVTCDLATPIADTTAALFGDVDCVINFASESHIPRSLANPVPFVQNNINAMLHVLEYARSLPGLRAFVQISTDEVYGPSSTGGHAEWSSIQPSTPYSASKAAQEALAIAYWRSFGLPLVLANTMNPIGPMQDPEKFVPMAIGRVLRGETVSIHAGADGQIGSRVYVNARDLASAITHVLQAPPARYGDAGVERPDRWNVVGERDVDNFELAHLIADCLGLRLRHEMVLSDRPGHGLRYALDGAKLANAGWKSQWCIEDSVEALVAWSLANPLWSNRIPRP
jgi:dTDP-glucose 4,6-dehydratase